jgi:stage III sporulation protein AB
MVKLLGAVLVVGSFGVIGSVIASGYSERPRQLSALISGFALLETEISYSRTPLSEALIRAKGQKGTVAGRLFEIAACIIAEGDLSPGQAWEAAVRCIYPFSALTPEDREALLAFGSKLGSHSLFQEPRNGFQYSYEDRKGCNEYDYLACQFQFSCGCPLPCIPAYLSSEAC